MPHQNNGTMAYWLMSGTTETNALAWNAGSQSASWSHVEGD